MILPPDACETMADLRGEIDRVDRALLDLLAERQRYIDRAVVLKRRENLPARIGSRVAEVIANVRSGAERRGLDPAQAERIWADLIEAAIAREAHTPSGTEGDQPAGS